MFEYKDILKSSQKVNTIRKIVQFKLVLNSIFWALNIF